MTLKASTTALSPPKLDPLLYQIAMLRPIQVAYESPKFMLPIRLGMVNADGPQELFVYALTRKGRVEATNYRTVKLPTGMDLPAYVKDRFRDFYKARWQRIWRTQ